MANGGFATTPSHFAGYLNGGRARNLKLSRPALRAPVLLLSGGEKVLVTLSGRPILVEQRRPFRVQMRILSRHFDGSAVGFVGKQTSMSGL